MCFDGIINLGVVGFQSQIINHVGSIRAYVCVKLGNNAAVWLILYFIVDYPWTNIKTCLITLLLLYFVKQSVVFLNIV